MDRHHKQTIIHTDNTRSSISVHRNSTRSWFKSTYNYKQGNRGYLSNRYYKYLLAVGLSFVFPTQAYANVGGVSATAAPVANSSGSVTNQAIQVLQGPYITNTYGGGIQCQGPTRNFTPYVTGSVSASSPYEDYYDEDENEEVEDDGSEAYEREQERYSEDNQPSYMQSPYYDGTGS